MTDSRPGPARPDAAADDANRHRDNARVELEELVAHPDGPGRRLVSRIALAVAGSQRHHI